MQWSHVAPGASRVASDCFRHLGAMRPDSRCGDKPRFRVNPLLANGRSRRRPGAETRFPKRPQESHQRGARLLVSDWGNARRPFRHMRAGCFACRAAMASTAAARSQSWQRSRPASRSAEQSYVAEALVSSGTRKEEKRSPPTCEPSGALQGRRRTLSDAPGGTRARLLVEPERGSHGGCWIARRAVKPTAGLSRR